MYYSFEMETWLMAGNSTWDGGVGKSAHGAARLPDIGSAAQWFPPSGGLVRLVVECRSYHRMAHVWNICQVDDILIIIIIMIITINIIIVIMILIKIFTHVYSIIYKTKTWRGRETGM